MRTHPATFVIFDVLLAGESLLHQPLMERKRILHDIVKETPVMVPTHFVEGRGKALFQRTGEIGLEGIVAKKKDSLYVPDTTSLEWIKIKHFKTIDTVILGYRTAPRFALVVGLNFRTVKNKPVGVVEWGFTPEEKQSFLDAARLIHLTHDGKTHWIEPRLCCRIEYLERTEMHQLRTTVFRGFLPDQRPEDCVWHG